MSSLVRSGWLAGVLAALAAGALPAVNDVRQPAKAPLGTIVAGGEKWEIAGDEIGWLDGGGAWQAAEKSRALRLSPALADSALVLYPAGLPRTEKTRRWLTAKIVVSLDTAAADGQESVWAKGLTEKFSLTDEGAPLSANPSLRVLRAPTAAAAAGLLEALRAAPGVAAAEPLMARWRTKRSLPNDPLIGDQWHLDNTGQTGGIATVDVQVKNVWGAWSGAGTRGDGVRVGIVDDGLETAHPDLAANVEAALGRNWNGGPVTDPNPRTVDDVHGTAVAGLVGAVANNGIGVAGVAPECSLVGLRLIAGPITDSQEQAAFDYQSSGPTPIHVKNNSWGGGDDVNHLLDGPGPLARAALANATANGRGGRGTIFVFAAGNGGLFEENSNFDGYANDIHVIAVGSVDHEGAAIPTSEPGANVLVVAPSGDEPLVSPGVVTTDRTSTAGYNPPPGGAPADYADTAYTGHFGGTSAAAPCVAGVCALMLQTNPNLGWRDVQEILLRTARKNDPEHPGWRYNAGGFRVHDQFGYGLVNAEGACAMAVTWTNLAPHREGQPLTDSTVSAIPDNNAAGISRSFAVPATQPHRVEHVAVRVKIQHTWRSDLQILLTSPSGTQSTLAFPYYDATGADDYNNWLFTSVQFWGETAQGTWTVTVADRQSGDTGQLQSVTLQIMGSDPCTPPVFTSASNTTVPAGGAVSFQVAANNGPITYTTASQLPPFLSLNPTTGLLTGTVPNQPQTIPIGLRATNACSTVTQPFSLRVVSKYEAWAAGHGLSLAAGGTPNEDPDSDGLPNIVEYAFDTDPAAPTSSGPFLSPGIDGSGRPFVEFPRLQSRDDIVYELENSSALETWGGCARSTRGGGMMSLQNPRFQVSEQPPAAGRVLVRVTDTVTPRLRQVFRLHLAFAPPEP